MPASTETKASSEKLVRDFLGSWNGRNIETICGAFAADAMYHNVPVKPIHGIAGIRQIFEALGQGWRASAWSIQECL